MRAFVATFAFLSWVTGPASAWAAPLVETEVSPYIGGGTTSAAQVTSVSGVALGIGHDFDLNSQGLKIAPRLEVMNTFIDTKAQRDGATTLGSYDSLVLALGGRLSDSLGAYGFMPGQRVYGSLMLGRSLTKLSLDSNSTNSATLANYEGISGSYTSAEVGTQLPFQTGFGLTIAACTSLYQQNQGTATGRFSQDRLNSGGQLALAGDQNTAAGSLPDRVYQRTFTIKVGLALSF